MIRYDMKQRRRTVFERGRWRDGFVGRRRNDRRRRRSVERCCSSSRRGRVVVGHVTWWLVSCAAAAVRVEVDVERGRRRQRVRQFAGDIRRVAAGATTRQHQLPQPLDQAGCNQQRTCSQ